MRGMRGTSTETAVAVRVSLRGGVRPEAAAGPTRPNSGYLIVRRAQTAIRVIEAERGEIESWHCSFFTGNTIVSGGTNDGEVIQCFAIETLFTKISRGLTGLAGIKESSHWPQCIDLQDARPSKETSRI